MATTYTRAQLEANLEGIQNNLKQPNLTKTKIASLKKSYNAYLYLLRRCSGDSCTFPESVMQAAMKTRNGN